MLYQYSLYWFNPDPVSGGEILLGDHFRKADAEAEIKTWTNVCEDPAARDRDNYVIRRIQE